MLRKLLHFVLSVPGEGVHLFSLEDMALCVAWFDAHREDGEVLGAFARFPDTLDKWVNLERDVPAFFKTQPVLEALAEKVLAAGCRSLGRDELDVIHFAAVLAQRRGAAELWEGPLGQLRPYLEEVQERRAQLEPVPDFPALADLVRIVDAEGLAKGKEAHEPAFAGVPVPFRGRLCRFYQDTKVLGGLPEGFGLQVERGRVIVIGPVAGFLSSRGDAEVSGPIEGVVISHSGEVRADFLGPGSLVVAKEGALHCRDADHPSLLYAYQRIHVRGDLRGGTCFSRAIRVAGKLEGGRMHCAGKLRAGSMGKEENRPLSIVLRREISCDDYGEVMSEEARRLYLNALKERKALGNLRHSLEILQREADEYAGRALLFLLGGEEAAGRLRKLERLRGYASYLGRLREGAAELAAMLRERLALSEARRSAVLVPEPVPGSLSQALGQLETELHALAKESPIDRELFNERQEAVSLCRLLGQRDCTLREARDVLAQLAEKTNSLSERWGNAMAEIEQEEAGLAPVESRLAILERARETRSRVEVLAQLVAAAKMRADSGKMANKLDEGYMKLLMVNMEQRQTQTSRRQLEVLAMENKLRELRIALREEHELPLPDLTLEESAGGTAQVTGRFQAGVRLCLWPHQLDEEQGGEGVLATGETGDETVTYRRTSRGTIERVKAGVLESHSVKGAD